MPWNILHNGHFWEKEEQTQKMRGTANWVKRVTFMDPMEMVENIDN